MLVQESFLELNTRQTFEKGVGGTGWAPLGCPSQNAYSQYKMPPKELPRLAPYHHKHRSELKTTQANIWYCLIDPRSSGSNTFIQPSGTFTFPTICANVRSVVADAFVLLLNFWKLRRSLSTLFWDTSACHLLEAHRNCIALRSGGRSVLCKLDVFI